MLKLDIRPNESLRIGDAIVHVIKKKSGNLVTLVIDADRSIPIERLPKQEDKRNTDGTRIAG